MKDLDNLYHALQPAIEASHLKTSNPAFFAFFKQPLNARFVREVRANVSRMAIPSRHHELSSGVMISPEVDCSLSPGTTAMRLNGKMVDTYTLCKRERREMAYYLLGYLFIILCPNFFIDLEHKPLERNNCGVVNRTTNFVEGIFPKLMNFQIYVLGHALVRELD